MKSVVIIPARYNSSRYPGKPLVKLLGKPMILWVAELSACSVGVDNVYIATDDLRISDVANKSGFKSIITTDDALTGTDRLAQTVSEIDADIYINVQGDEPLVDPKDIIKIRDAKIAHINDVINGFSWMTDQEDPHNINIPKVITNENGMLIYMSRVALPGFKDSKNSPKYYKKQVCIYAYTREELLTFSKFGRKSQLESFEDIEILRFMEFGGAIRMIETSMGSLAVDVPSDVPVVEAALKRLHFQK